MFPWETRRLNAKQAVDQLGLTAALVLDAGDRTSYTGSGTTWADLSGNSRDFTATGATFTGTTGGLTSGEYWALDGGSYFVGTNDTFFNGLHKDGATVSFVAAVYIPDLAGTVTLFSTASGGGTGVGVVIDLNINEAMRWRVGNGSSLSNVHLSTATLTASAWNVVGFSIAENGGAAGSFSYVNGTVQTFNAGVSSPSSSNAGTAATFGASNAGASSVLPNGSRLGAAIMAASAWTAADFDAIRAYLLSRYP